MPPVSMTRTSCMRSATVWRSPSRLEMMPRGGGGAHALGGVDRPVAVLVEAATAVRNDCRRARGRDDRQRAESAAAVADDVDRDRRDAAVRERRGDSERGALLTVGETVTEDRHRPATGGRGPGRDEQIEMERVGELDS